MGSGRKTLAKRAVQMAVAVACMGLLQAVAWGQRLTSSANPPSGVAGYNYSYLTGSGFPAGTITGATIEFGDSCASPSVAETPVVKVAVESFLRRFEFLIPSSLKPGTYYAWVLGTAGTTAFNTLNTPSCSEIQVTASSATLAACVPTSSLAVFAGPNVNAYVPFAWWEGGHSGIEEVPLEGSSTPTPFTAAGQVNSCASNSVTGEVVCTENDTTVDLINGTTLTTLTSGSNTYAGFSGGSCNNCGVGINATDNTAVIAMGYTPSSSSTALQVLNLSNNTFDPPFSLQNEVSEDISIDPTRKLILSPSEYGVYDLLQIGTGDTLTEYTNSVGGELDSAAEDCTTGIALASDEFSNDVYITDLTQAAFTAGSGGLPGTWTAPGQFVDLSANESYPFSGFAAGTCGISSAPGSGHLAVVTGEFGGSSFAALQLPSASGSGTPSFVDYAYAASLPATPDGMPFNAGYDPHTVTAYTSPNDGKSYAVMVGYGDLGTYPYLYYGPKWLAVIDLAGVLSAPRIGTTNTVDLSKGTPWVRYVPVPTP